MSFDNLAIRVDNVGKCYEMYGKPSHRLWQTLTMGHKTFYKEFWALRNIGFEVKKGECVGIIGRNGSGKSTLLQIIAGTLNPTTGDVAVHGRVAALLELGSGFNPEFTGRDNVYMNASILGLSKTEIDTKYDEIVEFADIGDFINQPVKTYSSGMMVRLAFAVVAHVNADILIVDEALAVGDVFFVQKCMRFIRKFMETHTMLFVSHDTGAIASLCNRALLLSHGSIKMFDKSKLVIEQYMTDAYESQQGSSNKNIKNLTKSSEPFEIFRDMRQDFINTTNLRNDIQILPFNIASSSFGTGESQIKSVVLCDEDDNQLSWVVGGEVVKLKITCLVLFEFFSPIIGFAVKDRLGQWLFADNTYLTYMNQPLQPKPGNYIQAVFVFRMPIMPKGDYSIMTTIAKGTQNEHQQIHYMHDALFFKSQAPLALSLMGIPCKEVVMKEIELV